MSLTTTRWRPTPEQFMMLEELYKRGVTNPNASQIQNISAHLSLYGQIQGKNVFYWFQNHKARDRKKLRKRFSKHQHYLPHLNVNYQVERMISCNMRMHKDVREDRWMRMYGQDWRMIAQVGPTTLPSNSNKPLQTLELFPLTSYPPLATAHDQKPTAANQQFSPQLM